MNYRRALALLACASVACSPPASDAPAVAPTPVGRDSAGITIVENPPAATATVPWWTIDTVPSVVISSASAGTAAEFTAIGGVTQLNGGTILVLDGRGETAFEFRLFDSTGRHIATHGRMGQGPGEYRWVNFIGSGGGDTILAVDFPNRRLNWLTVAKGFVRSVRLDEVAFKQLLGADASGTAETLVPLDDSVYAIKAFRRRETADAYTASNSYHIVDIRKRTSLDLATFDEPAGKRVALTRGRSSAFPVEAGTPVHVVDRARKRICAAFTRIVEIRCVDADGRRTFIRWDVDSVAFTAADREAYEARMRANAKRWQMTDADASALLGATEFPKYFAPFSVLQLDAAGNFWMLEQYLDASGARKARFRILDAAGRQIAFADPTEARSVGLGYRPFFGANAVLRTVESADGAIGVGVFPIRKAQ